MSSSFLRNDKILWGFDIMPPHPDILRFAQNDNFAGTAKSCEVEGGRLLDVY